MEVFIYYLLAVNIAGFVLCTLDKLKAKLNLWRISEKALLTNALIGGSLGVFLAMQLFRHKTRTKKFILVPILLLVQVVLIYVYYLYIG